MAVCCLGDSVARKCAGFGASEGSCNPVKVTLPELPIEGGIRRTQAGQLDLNIRAVTRRGERDLNECRCRRRCVGSLTVPSNHQAVRGIDFDAAADDHRPVEVKVERVPRLRSRHDVSSALTRAAHVREAQAVRAGWVSSRKARPEQPTGSDEVSRITNGRVSASASCGCTCVIQEPCAGLGDGCA